MRGTVKWFNDKKGYGFIVLDGGGDAFCHYTGIVMEGHRTLKAGDRVEFSLREEVKGLYATEVIKLT